MTHPGFPQNTIPLFLQAFQQHLDRLNSQSDDAVQRFIYHYLPTGVCNQIAAAAVDKMTVTLADHKEHSSALIKPPVVYDIATMPIEMDRAREWFAREHGSYSQFVEEMWQAFKKMTKTSSIFCHIMYGWGKDGGWVHLGVWPMEESADSEALIIPIECLTDEEKRTLGYDTDLSPSNTSAESGNEESDILSAADSLTYFASREKVQAGDIDDALEFLVRLVDPPVAQRFKGRLFFGISGYDEDPRELYQIPEVRLWMRELDVVFPYWFYFLFRHPSTMEFVTLSLCDYVQTPNGAQIMPHVLADFMSNHFAAMNRLCEKLGESKEEIERLSKEVEAYFFG
jgi:hypothetical protein